MNTPSQPRTEIRSLVFDFGGVIFVNPQTPDMTTAEHDVIWSTVRGLAEEYSSELTAGTFTFVRFTQLFHRYTPNVRPHIRERIYSSIGAPDQSVLALIDRYHRHYAIYGLVNASPGWTELRRGINGLDYHFTRVLASHEVNVRKPDKKIFQHLVEQTGIQPSTSVFIDDQPENVAAAQAQGFHAHVYQDIDDLSAWLVTVLPISSLPQTSWKSLP